MPTLSNRIRVLLVVLAVSTETDATYIVLNDMPQLLAVILDFLPRCDLGVKKYLEKRKDIMRFMQQRTARCPEDATFLRISMSDTHRYSDCWALVKTVECTVDHLKWRSGIFRRMQTELTSEENRFDNKPFWRYSFITIDDNGWAQPPVSYVCSLSHERFVFGKSYTFWLDKGRISEGANDAFLDSMIERASVASQARAHITRQPRSNAQEIAKAIPFMLNTSDALPVTERVRCGNQCCLVM